ncbi:MAG: dihydroorotate dehydrogenase electron transfer subunit [Treponema sp.]|nr:dihydroorotate dehydrogenase electron transfer subunit [Treponema sp.]
MSDTKQSAYCELVINNAITKDIFQLDFVWPGAAPKAGQFFMVKPKQSAVFLARPISVALWKPNTVKFLIARRGTGTRELEAMRLGEEAELIGPLGNAWADFLPKGGGKPIALIGGGIGIAPLEALLCELPDYHFHFYAGFRKTLKMEEKATLLGPALLEAEQVITSAEFGKEGRIGLIPDFLEPEQYAAVCACGPEPMLKAVAAKCKNTAVPCFVSLERRMACGVGACLGCTVQTSGGNRRCCADGPIFRANEVY